MIRPLPAPRPAAAPPGDGRGPTAGDGAGGDASRPRRPGGRFGYLLDDAGPFPHLPDPLHRFGALVEAMAAPGEDDLDEPGTLPPFFPWFGRFVAHDLARCDVAPLPATGGVPGVRATLEDTLVNGRHGVLRLDSLYGADGGAAALRDGPRMRLGRVGPGRDMRPPLPADDGADLPRLGALLDAGLAEAEVLALAEDGDALAGTAPGSASGAAPARGVEGLRARAAIADPRNDTNLVLAQLHLALLRFHNAVAEALPAALPDRERFDTARREVTWTYQWLVLHAYLPHVGDPEIVHRVIAARAPLYRAFRRRLAATGTPCAPALPVPLECTEAAFRLGQVMTPARIDLNRNYPLPGSDGADARLLRAATGLARDPLLGRAALPADLIVEWDRFIEFDSPSPARYARPIDTRMAATSPGTRAPDEETDRACSHALGLLLRGYALNLPSAQQALTALAGRGITLPALAPAALRPGGPGHPLPAPFETATPLWFYVLREAALMGGGAHLGPLGTHLVAETLVGLLAGDPGSAFNQPGSGPDGRWAPRDGSRPAGEPVESFAALLRAAGLLA